MRVLTSAKRYSNPSAAGSNDGRFVLLGVAPRAGSDRVKDK
jgi:chloramphenicol 3-O-phosphotransferase